MVKAKWTAGWVGAELLIFQFSVSICAQEEYSGEAKRRGMEWDGMDDW